MAWLNRRVALAQGMPWQDTFGRVCRLMNPPAFQERLLGGVRQIGQGAAGEGLALDGKPLRGAHDVPAGTDGLARVSAWAVEPGIGLGQRKVDDQSNGKYRPT